MNKKEEFFEELSEQLDFSINEYVYAEDIENYDELYEQLEDQGAFQQEVIYYYNAIEYLKENDASLRESMALADDYGCRPIDINSELLASLLKSQKCREEFSELRSEIESFLEDYEEESFCYCGEEIEVGEEYCSKECKKNYENEIT
tara:strand:+ start:10544 stop:10984 length:441 start_codon:yes stop_codon:yes gene_type:complete